jgi:hypothetical protein
MSLFGFKVKKTSQFTSVLLALALLAAACGSDDGAAVREIGSDSGSSSASASASASGSSSGSSSSPSSASASGSSSGSASTVAEETAAPDRTVGDDGYDYASDVSSHRMIPADVCDVNALLPKGEAIDWAAVEAVYQNGGNSVKSSGAVRTLAGFASGEGKKHGVDEYYGTATPLNDFVMSAIQGTGEFAGESDSVRRQGVQKGIQNQILVAWTVHELHAALAKAADKNFDVESGAPHNWDEGWAFYSGAEPGCAAYGTGNKRGKDFKRLSDDGETSVANENILAHFIAGRDALLAGDAAGAQAAADEIKRNLVVIYSQASLKYAKKVDSDLAAGDQDAARIHQAEGYAFWRVLAPMVAGAGADTATVDAFYSLTAQPAAGGYDLIADAIAPAMQSLGISDEDLGEY